MASATRYFGLRESANNEGGAAAWGAAALCARALLAETGPAERAARALWKDRGKASVDHLAGVCDPALEAKLPADLLSYLSYVQKGGGSPRGTPCSGSGKSPKCMGVPAQH